MQFQVSNDFQTIELNRFGINTKGCDHTLEEREALQNQKLNITSMANLSIRLSLS